MSAATKHQPHRVQPLQPPHPIARPPLRLARPYFVIRSGFDAGSGLAT